MTDNTECCGWASWGELAGMGDGRVRVDAWDGEETVAVGAERGGVSSDETLRAGASTPAIVAGRRLQDRAGYFVLAFGTPGSGAARDIALATCGTK